MAARRSGDRFARIAPSTLADWRAWLAANHEQKESVWLVVTKASAGGAFTLSDAVDQALCFGWIDSLPRKLDAARTMLLFSPRKQGSGWSAVNKAKIARLIADGQMAAPGLAKIAAAKADGSWTKLDAVDALKEPDDLAAALDVEPKARANWNAFPPSARRGILEWLGNAKTPATRARRVAETVTKAARGERALQWKTLAPNDPATPVPDKPGMIPVTASIALDPGEIEMTFIRASGPGGQNVNKVSSAVQLRFDMANSPNLPEDVKERLAVLAGARLTKDGVIVLTADQHRTQERNKADAVARLVDLVARAAHRPKPRKATRPSRAVKERRVDAKVKRGALKARRGGPIDLD